MHARLVEFINNKIDLIDGRLIEELYNKAYVEIPFLIGELTTSLQQIELDPLSHFEYVMKDMFFAANIYDIRLPNGIIAIHDSAFESCVALGRVILPETICRIDSRAFDGCISLRDVRYEGTFASLLDRIGKSSLRKIFKDCPLKTIECADGYIEL